MCFSRNKRAAPTVMGEGARVCPLLALIGGTLADKRDIKRHKKRLSIHFGIEEATRVAFTEDISLTGMFIRTANVCPPNSKIKIEFNLADDKRVALEARVMWAKKVPQNLFHLVKKSGMGVRILNFRTGEEHFREFCESMNFDR